MLVSRQCSLFMLLLCHAFADHGRVCYWDHGAVTIPYPLYTVTGDSLISRPQPTWPGNETDCGTPLSPLQAAAAVS